jgi:catechol 2,3-dioxygenase-like lactoylglutathione lyase family enzyme
MKLEVAVLSVSDVDRAKEFCKELGWREDADFAPGPAPEHKSYGSFASFSDPDGNGWLIQEITTRLPGR